MERVKLLKAQVSVTINSYRPTNVRLSTNKSRMK